MFTGIVEETGKVAAFSEGRTSWRLEIEAKVALGNAAIGDSIAVNGCCLTIAALEEHRLCFDVLEETRRLTNFHALANGAPVNLERSLQFAGKVGGHFVTGHIDGLGVVEVLEQRGHDYFLKVRSPVGSGRYLIYKGSVAIDGISLTVAEVEGDAFAVWLIPHTITATNVGTRRAGERVNLEFDLLGKYVEKQLSYRTT